MVSEVVSHLHPVARAVLDHSEAERAAWIRTERWIGYPRAHHALTILEDLLTLPVRQRMPGQRLADLVVIVLDVEDAFDAALRARVPVVRRIRCTTDNAAQLRDVLNRHAPSLCGRCSKING